MNFLKTILNLPFVAKFINHELGGFVVAGVGAIVGAGVGFLHSHFHLQLVPGTEAEVTLKLTTAGTAIAGAIVQYIQTGSTKALQSALGVEPDGWVGPVTIKRATLATEQEVASAEANHPGNSLLPPPRH